MTRARGSGFLLVMVAGFLTLLALISASFLAAVRLQGAASRLTAATMEARLAAEAGLAYAAGRLWESTDPFPGAPRLGDAAFDVNASRKQAVANRGDDWRYRAYDLDDGSWFADQQGAIPVDWLDPPLLSTDHPSYAHGEAWEDDGDALFEAGEKWLDADGNGRRDVYSGRLRGKGPAGTRFRLRVEAGAEAKIPINSRPDPTNPLHLSLVEFVNRLGAVLGVSPVSFETLGGSGVPLVWSDVGDRIFAAYPEGGWGRVGDLRSVLPEGEYRALRRFVTTASPFAAERFMTLFSQRLKDGDEAGGGITGTSASPGMLNLNTAPVRLLEAFLRYRRAAATDRVAHALFDAASDVVDPHTGTSYTAYPGIVILHPAEAFRAAAGLSARMRVSGGFRSRLELFRFIDWQKQTWFPNGIMHAAIPAAYPSEGYQNVKADMTFASFFDQRVREAPAALATYDVDRFVRTAPGHYPGSGRQREQVPLSGRPASIRKPVAPYQGGQPFDGGGSPSVADFFAWCLGPPSAFDVLSSAASSEGHAVTAEGSCRVGECVHIGLQEDFQNLGGRPVPWGPPDANPPETRVTTRGIRVRGAPSFSTTSGMSEALDVVTIPLYPRETFDPGAFYESAAPGGVTLAHAPQDYLAPTGGRFQARFEYLTSDGLLPDLEIESQQVWAGAGFSVFPVRREMSDSLSEKYRGANAEGMRAVFNGSTPFGVTLGGNDRYSFYQVNANNPSDLLALPAGRVDVPAAFMDDAYDPTVVSTGDFQAITNLVFHLTYTGPLTGSYGSREDPTKSLVFTIQTSPNEMIQHQGGGTRVRLWKRADGAWVLEFLNGTLVTIDPLNQGRRYVWSVNSWGSWLPEPDVVEGHTQRFTGFYKPPPAPGGEPENTVPRDPSWEETAAVHRITFFYFARDADAGTPQYPPTAVRCGVLIDGQTVIDHVWARAPNAPCLPFRPDGYDPRAAPYPSAEMFYRLGPSDLLNGLDLAQDGRRILDVSFSRCADVVFATAPGGDNPDTGSAFGAVKSAHNAYRAWPRDFFRRKGDFSSARYVLPEPMVLGEANWGGVIPQLIWERLASPEKAMALSLHAWREDGSLAGTIPLVMREMGVDQAGGEKFYLPLGSRADPLGRGRIRAVSFDAAFDVSGWNANNQPLTDAPALEEMWLFFRTPIRWLDGAGKALDNATTQQEQ